MNIGLVARIWRPSTSCHQRGSLRSLTRQGRSLTPQDLHAEDDMGLPRQDLGDVTRVKVFEGKSFLITLKRKNDTCSQPMSPCKAICLSSLPVSSFTVLSFSGVKVRLLSTGIVAGII